MIQNVLWDLDGTVLDSKEGVYNSIRYTLSHLSMSIPPENELLAFLGPPIADGFARVCHVPAEHVNEAIRLYRVYYNNGGMLEASIYDGVPAVLRALRERGIRSYITTSKPQVYAQRILAHFGIADLFDGIYGAELDGSRAEKADVLRYCMDMHELSPQRTVLIGDRRYDVIGASHVGIPCIGVLYGYGDREELISTGASAVVETTPQLLTEIHIDS